MYKFIDSISSKEERLKQLQYQNKNLGLEGFYKNKMIPYMQFYHMEDFNTSEEVYEITTDPSSFSEVSEKLQAEGITFLEASVQMVPSTTVALDDQASEKMEKMIERLEDLDDVMNVYHNWE